MEVNKIVGVAAFGLPVLFAVGNLMTPPFVVQNSTILLVILGAVTGLLNVTVKERPWVAIISALAAGTFIALSTYLTPFDVFARFLGILFDNLAAVLAPIAMITILAELFEMVSKK